MSLSKLNCFNRPSWKRGFYFATSNNLSDVTNGQEIRGTTTSQDATGSAYAYYKDNIYWLNATFTGLQDPESDDFYEGWIVQQSPFKVLSTWKLEKQAWAYVNKFSSDIDLRSYDFYVLTLEPNDDNSAPADHIFEGTIIEKDWEMKENMSDEKEKKMTWNKMVWKKPMMKQWMKKMMMNDERRARFKQRIEARLEQRVSRLTEEKISVLKSRIATAKNNIEMSEDTSKRKMIFIEVLDLLLEVIEEKETQVMN